MVTSVPAGLWAYMYLYNEMKFIFKHSLEKLKLLIHKCFENQLCIRKFLFSIPYNLVKKKVRVTI